MTRPTFKTQNEEIAFTQGMLTHSYKLDPSRTGYKKHPKLQKAFELGIKYREAMFPGR